MHFSIFAKATFRKLQEKYRAPEWSQKRDPDFARACAVEMRVNISQEPLYTDIYEKNAAAQLEHPDQAPAFTLTVRTPQCCLGNDGKSQCLIGKSTISMAIFTSSSVKLPHGIITMMV